MKSYTTKVYTVIRPLIYMRKIKTLMLLAVHCCCIRYLSNSATRTATAIID